MSHPNRFKKEVIRNSISYDVIREFCDYRIVFHYKDGKSHTIVYEYYQIPRKPPSPRKIQDPSGPAQPGEESFGSKPCPEFIDDIDWLNDNFYKKPFWSFLISD